MQQVVGIVRRNAAACGQSPPCVGDGQERSQIVGKQAPPRPGVPMLSRSSSGDVPSKSTHHRADIGHVVRHLGAESASSSDLWLCT
jgi:hypothetical protein